MTFVDTTTKTWCLFPKGLAEGPYSSKITLTKLHSQKTLQGEDSESLS